MRTIEFRKPFTFEGKEYNNIVLDLDSLTGRDLIKAEAESRVIAGPSPSPMTEFSKPYNAVVAAKAAKVPVDMILDLPAREFTSVTVTVQDFLFGMDLIGEDAQK
jgi:hypothetical protein